MPVDPTFFPLHLLIKIHYSQMSLHCSLFTVHITQLTQSHTETTPLSLPLKNATFSANFLSLRVQLWPLLQCTVVHCREKMTKQKIYDKKRSNCPDRGSTPLRRGTLPTEAKVLTTGPQCALYSYTITILYF